MSEERPQYCAAMGNQEMLEMLAQLQRRFEQGELRCAALRLYKPDGSWEDIAIGGTPQDQDAALADLRSASEKAN